MAKTKGTIGILTGGGDVPGLNPAIRALTVRALREGYRVLGIRRGWAGLVDLVPDPHADNSDCVQELTREIVNRAGRTGGTFLHTSRTRPSHLPITNVPPHLQDRYTQQINDVTAEVLKNIDFLGLDFLIPIGGDDTLSYGQRLHEEGVKVVAIPKTMDNDVPGTDYCIGFSTCVTRTIELTHRLRTSAGSHERFLVLEVFGRYAGFSAILPTMAGAADRCVIPEHPFDMEQLCELLSNDRREHPSNYSVVLISEGATMTHHDDMLFEGDETDQYGHKKLGGIGDRVARQLEAIGELAGAATSRANEYPGWKPDMDSELLSVLRTLSEKVYGHAPEVGAIHAGLECGIIGEKCPGMDMISFGPQIEFPHSPDERVKIDSVERFWKRRPSCGVT